MAISWKEIYDRFLYFYASGYEQEKPPSVTSTVTGPKPAEYDQNFQQTISRMLSDEEQGVAGVFGTTDYITWVAAAENTKDTRVRIYREMENNSWVSEGLDEYVSTGLNQNEKGDFVHLNIKNEDIQNNANMRENLEREFEYIIEDVVRYSVTFSEWFREFVLTGELGLELLVDHDNVAMRKNGVRDVKFLRSEQYVAYHNSNGRLEGFIIRNPFDDSVRVVANKNQVAYSDSGIYDYVSGIGFGWANQYLPYKDKTLRIARSFIDEARKPYKQLDALEDSVIIYRLSRAPERLVFNVATGNLPKTKAEQYLQKLINKFRKKLTYNPETGEVDQSQNVKNIMEDYWFVKDNSGRGTDVTTLGGATNLGEIEDIRHFLMKLYKAMKIPMTRLDSEGGSVFEQNTGGVSHQEIKFQKFVLHVLTLYLNSIQEVFTQHLKIKGIWQHYNLKSGDLKIEPVPPSYFSYMKNAEYLEAQFARFANFANNIDVEAPIFSTRMALKEGLGWSDKKIAQNEKWLNEEQKEKTEEGEEGMEGELGGEEEGGGGEPDLGL